MKESGREHRGCKTWDGRASWWGWRVRVAIMRGWLSAGKGSILAAQVPTLVPSHTSCVILDRLLNLSVGFFIHIKWIIDPAS